MDCYTGEYMVSPGKGRPTDSGDRGWLAALDKLMGFKSVEQVQAESEARGEKLVATHCNLGVRREDEEPGVDGPCG